MIFDLIAECFPVERAAVILGGREENQTLLDQRFDYIFFTGGVNVGRIVLEKAARYLTPVSLELGGKSPCIVDDSADIPVAARRIAFGKALNAGLVLTPAADVYPAKVPICGTLPRPAAVGASHTGGVKVAPDVGIYKVTPARSGAMRCGQTVVKKR